METPSVTSKGQVTIPKAIRQKLGIRAGSRVRFRLVGDRAELTRVDTSVTPAGASGAGMLRHRGPACPPNFDVASLLDPRYSRRR